MAQEQADRIVTAWRSLSDHVTAAAQSAELDDDGGALSRNVDIVQRLADGGRAPEGLPAQVRELFDRMVAAHTEDPARTSEADAERYTADIESTISALTA